MEMQYIINHDETWIPCTCRDETQNGNLHSNIRCTAWQTEPDLATAPTTVLENLEAAGAALIKLPVAGHMAAAAAMTIKTAALLAV